MTRIRTHGVTFLVRWSFLWWGIHLAWAQAPSVATTFPQDKAENLDCHFALTATLNFPSEANSLNKSTMNRNTVRLYPEDQPDSPLSTILSYNEEKKFLNLTCIDVLKPYHTYVFEVTEALEDDRGYSFLPYNLTFSTGNCGTRVKPPSPEVVELDPDQIETVIETPTLKWVGDSLHLTWATEQEFITQYFLIERAFDRGEFAPVGKVMGAGESRGEQQYFWLDADLQPGPYQYRVLAVDQLGKVTTSDTVTTFQNGVALQARIVVEGSTVDLEFTQAQKTTMVAVFYDKKRKIAKRKAGFILPGNQTQSISVEGLLPGDYLLVVKTPDQELVEPIRVIKK